MIAEEDKRESYNRLVNLFLEEICCELCRFQHVFTDGLEHDSVKVHREVDLGGNARFADICVYFKDETLEAYYMEVCYGNSAEKVSRSVARKYGPVHSPAHNSRRLILLVLNADIEDLEAFEAEISGNIHGDITLELWDEKHFVAEVNRHFNVGISSITDADLRAVRQAIDRAKWVHAFGEAYADHYLSASLLWHFNAWTLNDMHRAKNLPPEEIVKPGVYQDLAIVMADLSGFSRFVRHTHDPSISRDCLSIFYSAARDAIQNAGGLMYQFVGDEVIGIFGIGNRNRDYIQSALDSALALLEIGDSVSSRWERELDFLQETKGAHVGIAMGALNLLPYRPFSSDYIGFFGDALNLTARLTGVATQGEIVVSNVFYQQLSHEAGLPFEKMDAIEAKNVGNVLGWRLPANVRNDAS